MKQLSKTWLDSYEGPVGKNTNWGALQLLPERVLQFGTGVLLRGLPGYFIDKANKQGIFNGRIVVVKSTQSGGADAFETQNGLYVHWLRGIEHGAMVDEQIINASISRVINANTEWQSILDFATSADLQLVTSNTTEVGITLTEDNIFGAPPASFPGKLLAFLYKRYQHFGGSNGAGLVIVPTELIPENGRLLKSICLDLARTHQLEEPFLNWLVNANDFCDSLVDRIVPGKPGAADRAFLEKTLGVKDDLSIMSEPYALWAIESSNPRVSEILSFAQVHPGVVIAPDINKFRELKLRLLNGSHTFCCGLAVICGFPTVREAMQNKVFVGYLKKLMLSEIVPAITGEEILPEEAVDFSMKVIDRFSNPFIQHQWQSIALNYSSKMKMRNLPAIASYFERKDRVPQAMALGFAAMIIFLRSYRIEEDKYFGSLNHVEYLIQDDNAKWFDQQWREGDIATTVSEVLGNTALWGINAARFSGFAGAVVHFTELLQENDPISVIQSLVMENEEAEV